MELKGSKTEKNLMCAFAGESQARNKYTYFASVAKKEGYEQISAIFTETADNEKEHAKRFYKLLGNTDVEIQATCGSRFGNTFENLIAAAEGEYDEWHNLYCKAILRRGKKECECLYHQRLYLLQAARFGEAAGYGRDMGGRLGYHRHQHRKKLSVSQ